MRKILSYFSFYSRVSVYRGVGEGGRETLDIFICCYSEYQLPL